MVEQYLSTSTLCESLLIDSFFYPLLIQNMLVIYFSVANVYVINKNILEAKISFIISSKRFEEQFIPS